METIRARAEENVSLPQFIRGMLRHALRGHDISRIHFYRDGFGDAYNVDVPDKMLAESDAGLTAVCHTKEELFTLLNKWKMESVEKKRGGNKVSARVYSGI
jgi:hypothetical protein